MSEIELSGLPTVIISTIEFKTAAEAQGKAYGFTPTCVYTQHPIQDRTDAEMVEIADYSVEAIVAGLVQSHAAEGDN